MVEEPTVREKLESEVLTDAPWEALVRHFERDAVFLCRGVDVVEAGLALVNNETRVVQAWIAAGYLRRPTLDEAQAWEESQTTFQALIVQPWVLIRVDLDS